MAYCALDRIQYHTHLPEVQRFTQKYFLKRTMVRGKYNAVALGYNKNTHDKVIIKSVCKPEPYKFKEPSILKKIQHVPGVVKYLDHYAIKCRTYFLVLEHFGHMNLQYFLNTNGSVSEKVAHKIFQQLLNTVLECFKKNILHRKIKPSNVLIDVETNQIKIANFNSASCFDSEHFTSQLSSEIAPPEYFQTKKYTADGLCVWMLGLILYELLFNIKPFNSPTDVIHTPLIIVPHKQKLSLEVISLVKWMLAKSDRITLNEITHHPWVTKEWI